MSQSIKSSISDLEVLSDIEVNNGALFSGGHRLFDNLIIGHEEYVTLQEYSQFKEFVRTGGKLIVMGGDTFEVRVNLTRGVETLVAGHGWNFNGSAAVTSPHLNCDADVPHACDEALVAALRPFQKENGNWVGSSYLQNTGLSEDNSILNFTHTTLLTTYYTLPGRVVASYVHGYVQGTVWCFCRTFLDGGPHAPEYTQFLGTAATGSWSPRT
ncbi:MAG: hypothetical protein HY247_04065 [archaeon]|nr:MAG: hypothetical protein HY247_04065 [archaeon]